MLREFRTWVTRYGLFGAQHRLLIAVSGGIDSVVLLHMCMRLGYTCAIAHVNFGLRDKESQRDEDFVQGLAGEWKIPCHIHRADTLAYVRQWGVSVQMAARTLRYTWMQELCSGHGYDKILTAHHSDDALEGVLLGLAKGKVSAIDTLAVVREPFVRPLLFATRSDIARYAQKEGLRWCEDSSNASDAYQRNYIRNRIIPALEHINPSIRHTFGQRQHMRLSAHAYHKQQLEQMREELLSKDGSCYTVHIAPIRGKASAPWQLYCLLKPFGVGALQAESLALGRLHTGRHICTATHMVEVGRHALHITPRTLPVSPAPAHLVEVLSEGEKSVLQLGHMQLVLHVDTTRPEVFSWDKHTAVFDADRIQFPLVCRTWQAGDRLVPLGMQGRKKVSDILTDAKYSPVAKRQVYVLCDTQGILWVVGERMADPYKVCDQTQRFLVVTLVRMEA